MPELPPPHEQTAISRIKGNVLIHRDTGLFLFIAGNASNPNTASAQTHGNRVLSKPALVRGVVVTVTVKGDEDIAFRLMLAGTEQVAPSGAPVQVMVAVPLTPVPPITRL